MNVSIKIKFKYVCFIALLLVLTGVAVHYWGMRYLYDYDVTADYRYDFSPDADSMKKTTVKVHKDYFVMPKDSGDWDTGFLKINLKSTLIGKVLAPYVEVACEGKQYKQYFEFGAQGARYINISHVTNTKSDKVTITGHHLSWDTQDNNLLLFKNTKIADKKILVIAPHPDDAEIAAFGLYSYKNSYIVTVTDGSSGSVKYEKYFFNADKDSSYGLIAKLRVIDSLTVPMIGGVGQKNCYNLAYYSETLGDMHNDPSKEVKNKYSTIADNMALRKLNAAELPANPRPNWLSLINDLSDILHTVQPDIIVTPHPLLDTNLDHQFSTVALLEAIKRTKLLKEGKLYLYSNHYILGKSYPFGEQGSITTLPPLFSNIKFRSIYSYELTKPAQVEKLFAFDSMHDLRPFPYKIDISISNYLNNSVHAFVDYFRNGSEFDLSYYRKAIKSNELLFVYSFEDVPEILAGFNMQPKTKRIRNE